GVPPTSSGQRPRRSGSPHDVRGTVQPASRSAACAEAAASPDGASEQAVSANASDAESVPIVVYRWFMFVALALSRRPSPEPGSIGKQRIYCQNPPRRHRRATKIDGTKVDGGNNSDARSTTPRPTLVAPTLVHAPLAAEARSRTLSRATRRRFGRRRARSAARRGRRRRAGAPGKDPG